MIWWYPRFPCSWRPTREKHPGSKWRPAAVGSINCYVFPDGNFIAFTSYYLSAYARQPARGPTMLAHLVAICWPMLASCWPMWSEKIRKMGTAKKRCKTQDIWWSVAYLGAMLAYLEGNVGPSWGYVGPSWGYCWPILGAMLAHVGAMLAHLEAYVGPCWPILSHKLRKKGKNGKSTKHRKTRDFLAGGRGRRQGRRPLSPTERRELPYGKDTARGPLAGLFIYIYIYIY